MIRQEHHEEGDRHEQQHQTRDVRASMSSVLRLAVPEQVTVALAEIAESATDGLLALAVGAGL